MTRFSVRIAFLALSLVLAACAASTSTVRPIPGAEHVVAGAPQFAIGDQWRFTRGRMWSTLVSVVGFEGDLVIAEFTGGFPNFGDNEGRVLIGPDLGMTEFTGDTNCQLCWYYLDAHLTVARILDPLGKPVADAVVGQKILEFPLRVGKEWSQGSSRFKVEAYEEVTVKAGTFKAFRISQAEDQAGKSNTTRWWSPEARWFVKVERSPEAGFGADPGLDAELQLYTLTPSTARAPVTTTARTPITAVSVRREISLPETLVCNQCAPAGRERLRAAIRSVGLGEIAWIIGEEFEAQLKRQQPFPTVVSEGGDAVFELLARALGFQAFWVPVGGTRWRPVLALEGRLRRPDGSFAWRSFARVLEGLLLGYDLAQVREALSAAARAASKTLVEDLLKKKP